ncbi:MAG TPA: UDP-N-acetylmuramoyl-tripeptide--D-alanyl-D-alanine ligase [Candidatus Dormibacteraeota bacterium]
MRLSAVEVAAAVSGSIHGNRKTVFTSYHTDSRQVRPGGLFFALRGSETDGHRFARSAVEAGAAGVVVDRALRTQASVAVIKVADTWAALYDLAALVRRRVDPLVFGITGSNGKTSTKEMVAAALGVRHHVLKTEGNLNTETGLPLTVLRLEPDHSALALEMGMQGPGEIARLAQLARPQVGVITTIGTVHLEYFDSREALARAKGELAAALPETGRAVLPAESEYLELLRGLTRAPVVTFGAGGDYEVERYRPEGSGCAFEVRGAEVRLALGGRHMATNATAALAAAEYGGVPVDEGARALAAVQVDQRLQEHATRDGYRLVDDSYNASPESMLAAFDTVAERPHQRLLAVLGEMRELGSVAEESHREVGRRAAEVFDAVAVVDVGLGRLTAEAAGNKADLIDKPAAAGWVREHARPGDVVLIKASHGVHLEELVAELLAG